MTPEAGPPCSGRVTAMRGTRCVGIGGVRLDGRGFLLPDTPRGATADHRHGRDGCRRNPGAPPFASIAGQVAIFFCFFQDIWRLDFQWPPAKAVPGGGPSLSAAILEVGIPLHSSPVPRFPFFNINTLLPPSPVPWSWCSLLDLIVQETKPFVLEPCILSFIRRHPSIDPY